ncbi:hypothetical protein BC828DRAFT_407260 [Blastocladiella britannica]|nr:hypothetical protein BC828DRAFT_407260 [Blastocladiella britannica]
MQRLPHELLASLVASTLWFLTSPVETQYCPSHSGSPAKSDIGGRSRPDQPIRYPQVTYPATWLMKRLVRGLMYRTIDFQQTLNDLMLVPSPFSVPAVADWLLLPCRFSRPIAHRPLDEIVREWDAPAIINVVGDQWIPDTSASLASLLAAPRLRPVFTGELDRFKDVVRRLASVSPTLATATAPVTLWMRLGLDDRNSPRTFFSDLWDDDPPPITLPMYWAAVAAAEGRAAILEFLTAELRILDPRAFTTYLAQVSPSTYMVLSLMIIPSAERGMPTWRWLLAHEYQYPAEDCGILAIMASDTAS